MRKKTDQTMAIGVDPQKQSEQLGQKLMHPVLNETDFNKTPFYLDTFSKKTLLFIKNSASKCVLKVKP